MQHTTLELNDNMSSFGLRWALPVQTRGWGGSREVSSQECSGQTGTGRFGGQGGETALGAETGWVTEPGALTSVPKSSAEGCAWELSSQTPGGRGSRSLSSGDRDSRCHPREATRGQGHLCASLAHSAQSSHGVYLSHLPRWGWSPPWRRGLV